MPASAVTFDSRARSALGDATLRRAMDKAKGGFVDKRRQAVDALPEFQQLRQAAREIREHTLNHLDFYLQRYEQQVQSAGGTVHWAQTAKEATDIVVDICRRAQARKAIKGKSMVAEETGLNEALQVAGIERIETDLGEYIIQLADELPSHIIAPAVHKTREQITELFHRHHRQYGLTERVTEPDAIVNEARQVLRDAFVSADVGITGANFLIAETGSHALVTNEGNGDLTSGLPRVHIVTAGIEKVIPTLEDLAVFLRLLGRSATGQEMSAYTTLFTGPRRPGDLDGPEEFHVVLVDNGRSTMLGNEFHEMLRCIRCGACLNHCPVYTAIGGHAYGWVYSGPMGAVLTPLVKGLDSQHDLPGACTLNGRCEEVCPMQIPLPRLLRTLRARAYEQKFIGTRARAALAAWAFLARRPNWYRRCMGAGIWSLGRLGNSRGGRFTWLPGAGGWTQQRDLPAPQGETFVSQWHKRNDR